MSSAVRTFADYERVKLELLARCDRIEALWMEIRHFTAQTDAAHGTDDHEPHDVVHDIVARVRDRLNASMLEIGVFGEVNRGKSTLLNALLGREVSSMRVTPETAVPVWVERGVGDAVVIYADGRTEEVDDPADARERMTQRFRRLRPGDPVARVVQRVDVGWLPEGVRLIDTPGLSDPSLSAEYEELTLAELDRVAAAVFVFVSPPGIAAEEAQLLASLAERGVDKAFLVCNFYPEQWTSPDDRAQVVASIRSAVRSGSQADGTVAEDRLRIFEINARDGFDAAMSGDDGGLRDSGVAALRTALERHVAEDALRRLTVRSEGLVQRAKDAASDVLERRIHALSDRSRLEAARERQARDLAESHEVMTRLEEDCRTTVNQLEERLTDVMGRPFVQADQIIEKASTTSDLEGAAHRLRLASETAASKAAGLYGREVAVLEERVRRQLFDSFGTDDRFRTVARGEELEGPPVQLSTASVEGGPDAASIGVGALVAGSAGAFVGGSLAGGVGIALIAAGPVGWLIGAGLGALVGGVAGGAAGGLLTRDSISPQIRERLRDDIDEARRAGMDNVRGTCAALERELVELLRRQQESHLAGERAELARIDDLLADGSGATAKAVREARRLRAAVGEV